MHVSCDYQLFPDYPHCLWARPHSDYLPNTVHVSCDYQLFPDYPHCLWARTHCDYLPNTMHVSCDYQLFSDYPHCLLARTNLWFIMNHGLPKFHVSHDYPCLLEIMVSWKHGKYPRIPDYPQCLSLFFVCLLVVSCKKPWYFNYICDGKSQCLWVVIPTIPMSTHDSLLPTMPVIPTMPVSCFYPWSPTTRNACEL